jgi:hypothetical protein
MKVVINKCWGGFGLSEEAVLWIRKNKPCSHKEVLPGETYSDGSVADADHYSWRKDSNYEHGDHRDCPSLVAVVETLGERSWGSHAELKVIKIPNGIKWKVDDYDGMESIEEVHRSWG